MNHFNYRGSIYFKGCQVFPSDGLHNYLYFWNIIYITLGNTISYLDFRKEDALVLMYTCKHSQ